MYVCMYVCMYGGAAQCLPSYASREGRGCGLASALTNPSIERRCFKGSVHTGFNFLYTFLLIIAGGGHIRFFYSFVVLIFGTIQNLPYFLINRTDLQRRRQLAVVMHGRWRSLCFLRSIAFFRSRVIPRLMTEFVPLTALKRHIRIHVYFMSF